MIMMMSVIKQLMYEYLCYSGRTFSPIRGYLSAISFNLKKIIIIKKFEFDPTKSFAISRLLKTYTKLLNPQLTLKPMDRRLLSRLIEGIRTNHSFFNYYKLYYINIFLFVYDAALRVSEVARSNSNQHVILYSCITFNKEIHL